MKLFFKLLLLPLCGLLFASCAASAAGEKSLITPMDERMMWRIDSPSGTRVYVLGTIHLGDSQIADLSPVVTDLFHQADERYGELSLEDMSNLGIKLGLAMMQSIPTDGVPPSILSQLTAEQDSFLRGFLSDALGESYSDDWYEDFCSLPPWAILYTLQTASLELMGYSSVLGVDLTLYQLALQEGISVQGLDSADTQIQALSYGSYEDQAAMVKAFIASVQNGQTADVYQRMFSAYLSDDRTALSRILLEEDELEGVDSAYSDAYQRVIFNDRNRSWTDQIEAMLKEKNKTYFIFSGAGHWLGENTVFDMLVKDGAAAW